jgi:type IV secretion system protein VirB8
MALFSTSSPKIPASQAALGSAQTYFDSAIDWESSRIESIERSARRAWQVAGGACLVALCASLAIIFMLPLKTTLPYLIRVDSVTGVPDIVTTLKNKNVHYEEAINTYWLAKYVRAREAYDWHTLQSDYDTVGLLSSKPVGAQYAERFEGKEALDKKLGNSIRIGITILSVVPTSEGRGTVRFTKTSQAADRTGPSTVTHWVATIAYRYQNPSAMKEPARLVNPLGFQVMSYRVDPEFIKGDES